MQFFESPKGSKNNLYFEPIMELSLHNIRQQLSNPTHIYYKDRPIAQEVFVITGREYKKYVQGPFLKVSKHKWL
jgi:hypothetical protein